MNTAEGQLWANLSQKEQDELLLSIEECANSENLIDHEEMKKKHKKWLLKLNDQNGAFYKS